MGAGEHNTGTLPRRLVRRYVRRRILARARYVDFTGIVDRVRRRPRARRALASKLREFDAIVCMYSNISSRYYTVHSYIPVVEYGADAMMVAPRSEVEVRTRRPAG